MGKILSVINYPFYPPVNGGALRCFYLLRALAEMHDVTLLTIQDEIDFKQNVFPNFPQNITILSLNGREEFKSLLNTFLPKRYADAIHARIILRSVESKANSFLLRAYPVLKKKLYNTNFDLVLYENIEGLAFLRNMIKCRCKNAHHVLDAHNVDSSLWLQYAAIEKSDVMKQYAANAISVERRLNKTTSHVFACSEQDADSLRELNGGNLNVSVIPNGVDIQMKTFDSNESKAGLKEIIFCGALSTYPNKEGILWFYSSVFPLIRRVIPIIKLVVVGQISDESAYANLKADPFVTFAWNVPEVQPYYHRCSVAVVPLLSGSGTRLKILEAMSFGNPVVSTSKGAEGIKYRDGIDLHIADDEKLFAEKIVALLSNAEMFNSVRSTARKLVENEYDWRVVGKKMTQEIEQILTRNNGI